MNRRAFISGILTTYLSLFHAQSRAVDVTMNRKKIRKTGFVSDPVFFKHHIAPGHPETPERIKFIHSAMKKAGLLEKIQSFEIKQEVENWLHSIHTDMHIQLIQQNEPVAYQVAISAVGACLSAIDQVVQKNLDNAFCAIRPPGHHALNTGREEGFCYFNNIAIAARYAQKEYGLKKILIVDWDYHHGNSTEAIFYDDPSVLYFSTHDQFAYPGTGDPAKKGSGKGLGYNINLHLPCGTTDQEIAAAFIKYLLPAADSFKPDIVLISAGFDSRQDDLLGCFNVSDAGFVELTEIVMQIAEQHCEGRVVSILEGGYNLEGNARAVVSHVRTLLS